jgi:hypothetical protein
MRSYEMKKGGLTQRSRSITVKANAESTEHFAALGHAEHGVSLLPACDPQDCISDIFGPPVR